MHKYRNFPVEYLNPSLSDHSPLLINCLPDMHEGGRPFKFLNYLAEHSQLIPIIETMWTQPRIPISYMYSLWCKLKLVKVKLKTLHKEEFASISDRVQFA